MYENNENSKNTKNSVCHEGIQCGQNTLLSSNTSKGNMLQKPFAFKPANDNSFSEPLTVYDITPSWILRLIIGFL